MGTKIVISAAALLAALYVGVILAFSVTSSETVLARGQEKHFCEIDCHLAYSIVDLRKAKTVGSIPNQATAQGVFHIVTINTRFDENTISPSRGNAPLTPNSRVATITDAHGRRYFPSANGTQALAGTEGIGTPLITPLRPRESYTTKLVFDLPSDAMNPTLLIHEGEWMTHFVIGHENSFLHKKTRFQL